MNDGTTGIPVAPITEDDMNIVQNILKRAMDGMIGLSQLAADVEMLRATVSGLQADTERLRQTNANLDEALAYTRKERDEARSNAVEATHQLNDMQADRDMFKRRFEDLDYHSKELQTSLASARTERDDHGFKVMELEEALKQAEAKLAKLAEAHASVFGLPIPAEPQPETVKPYTEPLAVKPSEPSADPKPWEHEPSPDPARSYHGLSWSPGYLWDEVMQEYYTV